MTLKEAKVGGQESFEARLALARDQFSTNPSLIQRIQIATGDETIARLDIPRFAARNTKPK